MSEWSEAQVMEFELDGVVYELATRMRVKAVTGDRGQGSGGGLRGAARALREPPGERRHTGGPSAAPAEFALRYDDGSGWEIECPEHGWHRAKEWAAKGRLPAVVKCTGQSGSEFCDVKVPLGLAKRRANVR